MWFFKLYSSVWCDNHELLVSSAGNWQAWSYFWVCWLNTGSKGKSVEVRDSTRERKHHQHIAKCRHRAGKGTRDVRVVRAVNPRCLIHQALNRQLCIKKSVFSQTIVLCEEWRRAAPHREASSRHWGWLCCLNPANKRTIGEHESGRGQRETDSLWTTVFTHLQPQGPTLRWAI